MYLVTEMIIIIINGHQLFYHSQYYVIVQEYTAGLLQCVCMRACACVCVHV